MQIKGEENNMNSLTVVEHDWCRCSTPAMHRVLTKAVSGMENPVASISKRG